MEAYEQLESPRPVHGSVLVQADAFGRDTVYAVAGRSMFLDGGMHLLRLDPDTGRKLAEVVMDDRDPESGRNLQTRIQRLNIPVALPDILSSDGKYVYMRSQRIDLHGVRRDLGSWEITEQNGPGAHLFTPTGFLDDSWWHRAYWIFGRTFTEGAFGWPRAGH
jgi:hypothetical protein